MKNWPIGLEWKIDLRIKDTIIINQLINVFQSKTQTIQFTNIFKNSFTCYTYDKRDNEDYSIF